ncbi:hypothetical protein [Streptomyces geranii]|uniref:hypothetical protein n=1 Tax=Streptomyces geranii TaxID=2058923 RepID=UPI000D02DD9D|nr:hypothetical protein [Streptomyces geranii]
MRTRLNRTTAQFLLSLTLVLPMAAACGDKASEDSNVSKPSAPAKSSGRAQQVADAWDGSEAAEVWRGGYYPMGPAAPSPADGFHSDDDKIAHMLENYVLRGELPTTAPEKGQVKWAGGKSLTLPLLDARQTYTALDRVDSSEDPQLTVTGAKLGEMTIPTSRGPATVPAWLFTLEGYDEPLKRVALKSSKAPKPPIGVAAGGITTRDGLWELDQFIEASEDGRSVTVAAHHGACDDGPAVDVLETDGSVVLSASVNGGHQEGACTAQLLSKKVTVKLDRPLGDRILLDAFTGRPVPFKY